MAETPPLPPADTPLSTANVDAARAWPRRAVVAALLVLHLLVANAATWNKSATFDETAHIGNGFSFWATRDYRMAPDCIVSQRWMTLPLYLAGFQGPPTDNEIWFNSDNWSYGRNLLYNTGNDWWAMLHIARFFNSLWDVGTGLIVYWWAARLFGVAGGFTALVLYLFNPTVMAHGSSVTTDAAAAFAFTASIAALWHMLHRVTPGNVLLSGVVVGLAFATKFTCVLLIPIGVLMAIVRLAGRRPMPVRGFGRQWEVTSWWQQALVIGGLVVLHVLIAWVIIWTLFGFRFDMFRESQLGRDRLYTGDWETVLKNARTPLMPGEGQRNGLPLKIIETARADHLLPEAYLYIFTSSLATTSARSAFLNGRYGIFGFASFFPYCFLYKTPLALFALAAAAAVGHFVRRIVQIKIEHKHAAKLLWNGFYATSPLWILLAVYWLISITRGINIGIRHILPTFPTTAILVGSAGVWLYGIASRWNQGPVEDPDDQRRFAALAPRVLQVGRGVVIAMLVWFVGAVAFAFPNYLAYFNIAAGGTNQGYTHLVDSSLDWGQELPALKRWLDDNVYDKANRPEVFISYMGSSPPSKYGVQGLWLPCYFDIAAIEGGQVTSVSRNFRPGIYCISATMLQCVYNQSSVGVSFAGPWRADFEHNYQMLNRLAATFQQNQGNQPALDAALATSRLPNWAVVANLFEHASFGRLCASLRHRTPDAVVNGAFLIYNITKSDLEKALVGPPVEQFPAPTSPGANVPY